MAIVLAAPPYLEEAPAALAERIARVRLAQHFPGWTLEYIDQLSPFDLADIWGVIEADRALVERPK